MKPNRPPLLALLFLALSACAQTPTPSTPAPTGETGARAEPPPSRPAAAREPVAASGAVTFTDAQADRGRDIFRAACTECHYSGEFSEPPFKLKWSRRSAGNLYQLIHTSMPETAPGTLTEEEAVDIVSYIMRMNGFAPGSGELAADRAVLDGISLASMRDP